MPDIYDCEVLENEIIAEDSKAFVAHSVAFKCKELARDVRAGQFLHIKCGDERILRRPFSVCSVCGDTVKFVFEVKGKGTHWLSCVKQGDSLDILGPLGNGFDIPEGQIVVVGGGLGVPPMLFASSTSRSCVTAILGFRDAGRVMLVDDFKAVCDKVYLTTDDGSAGIHGLVTTPLEEILKTGVHDAVLACGQLGMMKGVADLCMRYRIPCQVSLEERMGCGVGACLVCVCATKSEKETQMSRVCKDGPVFSAERVAW